MTAYTQPAPLGELLGSPGDRWAPLRRREIASAVPACSRRAPGQRQWLRAVLADEELAGRRSDFSANVAAVARILARHADWRTRCTRPTRARICQRADLSVSTYKACRRFLEARGYLGTVRQGWTPHLRAAALVDPGDGNAAAVYVLAIPRQKPRLPAPTRFPAHNSPPNRPDVGGANSTMREKPREQVKYSRPKGILGAADAATHYPRHAEVLRKGPGQTITDGWIGYAMRRFIAAGWTPGDLQHAVEHRPDGSRHDMTLGNVREPRAWLIWRLSHWIGPDGKPLVSPTRLRGKPLLSPSQARAAARAADAELQDAGRAARAELAAQAVDPAPRAAAIRKALGWTHSRPLSTPPPTSSHTPSSPPASERAPSPSPATPTAPAVSSPSSRPPTRPSGSTSSPSSPTSTHGRP